MMGAERIGVPVEECVFVDDLRENCDGAAAVGMTPILHRGADTTLPELERLLGLESCARYTARKEVIPVVRSTRRADTDTGGRSRGWAAPDRGR